MKKKKDDGISNVVGELLLMAVAVILVGVFAASFFGVLPGERAEVIEFDQGIHEIQENQIAIQYNYLWGDFIPSSELKVTVYDGDNIVPLSSVTYYVTDENQNERSDVLDFGNRVVIWIPKPSGPSTHTYSIVLSGPRGILETKTMRVEVPS